MHTASKTNFLGLSETGNCFFFKITRHFFKQAFGYGKSQLNYGKALVNYSQVTGTNFGKPVFFPKIPSCS